MEFSDAQTIQAAFEAQARRTPGVTAVVAGTQRLSYAELDRRSERVAAALRARGAGPEALVGVCLPRREWLMPGLLGVLKAGAGYVPLDPGYPAERVRLIVQDAAPGQVLTDPASAALVAGYGAEPVLVDALPEPAEPPPGTAGSPGDLAYVFYTSGSTGRPKAVAIEHQQALAFLRWAAGAYTAAELAGTLAATSICFDVSVLELFTPLVTGGTVILAEHLLALPALPARDEVRMIGGVPSVAAALLERPLPAGVRTVTFAGEPLTAALRDRAYANPGVRRVVNGYGPTECTTLCLAHEVRPDEPGEPSLGGPVAGAEPWVLDPAGRPVADGAVGELWVAGPGVGRGYLHRPELTAQRFVADPAVAGGRRYRTGDLVRRIAGRYRYAGRVDDQVKVNGVRVELGEAQAALAAHPAVRVATVVAPREPDGTRRLVGYVEPATPVTEAELRDWLRARVPGFLLPARIAVLDRLPLHPNGKVDRDALPAVDTAGGGAGSAAPRDDLEAGLAALVAEVLDVPRVGVFDDFIAHGGHSLAAARVVSRVAERHRVGIPVARFLAEPTVAALAALVAAAPADPAPAPLPDAAPAAYRATDAQHQFWTLRRVSPTPQVTTVALRLAVAGLPSAQVAQAALDSLVVRHEALRTVLTDAGGELVAQARPPRPAPLAEHDLRGVPDQPARAARLARELASHAFDLTADVPLLRGALLWTGAGRPAGGTAELVLAIDHTACDGWSVGVLLAELADALAGTPPPAGPVPQLSAVAATESAAVPDPAARRYWPAALAGAVPPYDLPGRPRSGPPRHTGDRLVRRLDEDLVAGVRAVAARYATTGAAVWLAALAVLVECLTGRPDTLLGVAAAGRDRPGLDRVVGPLLTVLPVRVDLPGAPAFGALARHAFARLREAVAHGREIPADERVALAGVDRPAGAPLTPVVLAVQPEDVPVRVRRGEVEVRLLGEQATGAAPYDLTVLVNATADGPELQLEYATDRFDPADAEAFVDRLLRIVAIAVGDPDRPACGLDPLLPGERDWLLAAGDGGPVAAGAPATVVHGFLAAAARHPGGGRGGRSGRPADLRRAGRALRPGGRGAAVRGGGAGGTGRGVPAPRPPAAGDPARGVAGRCAVPAAGPGRARGPAALPGRAGRRPAGGDRRPDRGGGSRAGRGAGARRRRAGRPGPPRPGVAAAGAAGRAGVPAPHLRLHRPAESGGGGPCQPGRVRGRARPGAGLHPGRRVPGRRTTVVRHLLCGAVGAARIRGLHCGGRPGDRHRRGGAGHPDRTGRPHHDRRAADAAADAAGRRLDRLATAAGAQRWRAAGRRARPRAARSGRCAVERTGRMLDFALATAVQRPAYLAAIAQLVPKPYLPQANALALVGTGVGTLLAPLIGGALIVLLGLPVVILLDMATFLVGVVTLLLVRFPQRLFRRRDETFGAALSGGWRFIVRRRSFILMIGFFLPVNYLGAVTLVLLTPRVLSFGSPVTLGLVSAIGGLGAVVGSLAMVLWGGTRRRADGMIGFVSVVGVGTVLLGVYPATGPMATGLFLWWAATSILNAHWLAILQVKVGMELQGRVIAVNQMLATAMMPLGFVSAPGLATLVPSGLLLVLSGVLLTGWGVLGLVYWPLRHLEDALPDAVAGPEIADDLDELQAEIDARLR